MYKFQFTALKIRAEFLELLIGQLLKCSSVGVILSDGLRVSAGSRVRVWFGFMQRNLRVRTALSSLPSPF